ncbi:MAG: cation:proton antiporter [Bacteroidales bacterium]|jgi:NhaP-type Na+/H+ or K+/H+ antiporter|nr:cation:proton antiporter [Bacteroidales bacterium]MDD4383563.1 cation:proton antiporter [Bacteroidales bacterium]MDY0197306.1 cation:proton antiporter [Tenuifilaceae bacterium]
MENAGIIVFVGLIVFISHLFTGIFERKRIPDVLLLMIVGLLLGPIFGLITPEDFGVAGPMFTTITLVIILFEGGLALRFETLKNAIKGTSALTATNFFVTTIIVGLISWLLFGLHPVAGFMLGTILGGTSSAVVIPMVQQLRMNEDSRTILVLESAISDVLCIIFALALLETFQVEEVKIGLIVGKIISSFTLAALMGWLGALVWSVLLTRVRTIRNTIFTTPAFVFIIFGIAEMFGYSGAISALAFGITLANLEVFNVSLLKKFITAEPINLNETEKVFFSEIVFLLKTFFFIYIGLSIQLQNLWALVLGLLVTIILFISRVPIVKFSLRSPFATSDLTMISIMVPKGLAAAVLASLPLQQGIEGGEFIRDITYAVILISIIFTSVLIPLIERSATVRAVYGLFLRKGFLFWRRKK